MTDKLIKRLQQYYPVSTEVFGLLDKRCRMMELKKHDIIISADKTDDNNTLISWVGLGAPNINYFVRFAPKNSVADNGADAIAISFANNILTVNRDMPHVTIYDTTGRTVSEGRFAQKDLSHLDNGMYIVSANDGNSSTTLKIMIK